MPFRSRAQQRYLYSQHPRIAARRQEHTPKGKQLPERVKKKTKKASAQDSGVAAALEAIEHEAKDRRIEAASKIASNQTGAARSCAIAGDSEENTRTVASWAAALGDAFGRGADGVFTIPAAN